MQIKMFSNKGNGKFWAMIPFSIKYHSLNDIICILTTLYIFLSSKSITYMMQFFWKLAMEGSFWFYQSKNVIDSNGINENRSYAKV